MSGGANEGNSGAVRVNEHGQRIGPALVGWKVPAWPGEEGLEGGYCRLERLAEGHARGLHRGFAGDEAGWTYLTYGPFEREEDFAGWVRESAAGRDPVFYTILAREGEEWKALGVASYLRIAPAAGSIEVGHIHFARALQRTAAATEAIYLMMRYAFELGYRRVEWKCDSLNGPSRVAAQRLGFSFEGLFRNATIYKGRSRDTAWYAMTDGDWAKMRGAYERWLAAGNFDAGRAAAGAVVGVDAGGVEEFVRGVCGVSPRGRIIH